MIETGVIIGAASFGAIVIIIEKMPVRIKPFVFGHHLLTDLGLTALAFAWFPVTGAATLLAASTFCLLFTAYIFLRRRKYPWKRLHWDKWRFRILDAEAYHQLKSEVAEP